MGDHVGREELLRLVHERIAKMIEAVKEEEEKN
jgi:hypothetical protein